MRISTTTTAQRPSGISGRAAPPVTRSKNRLPTPVDPATPGGEIFSAALARFASSADEIAAHVERSGSACLQRVVSDEWIACALAEARRHGSRADYEVIVDDLESRPSSAAYAFANDPAVRSLLRNVTRAAAPELDTRAHPARTSFRVIFGEDPLGRPPNFHYDRSVVTMVVPLLVPAGEPGRSGELILAPNNRPFRRSALANVVEKAIVQTGPFRRRFVRRLAASTVTVPLSAGNAYLFWGYRSYHTTLPCPPNSERVTLVMHFGEVHGSSRLLRLTKSASRSWRLRRDPTITVHQGG